MDIKKTVGGAQSINVDTAMLRSAATQIRSSNGIMLEEANSILTTVESLESDWDSDIRKDLCTRVKKTEQIYQQYYSMLDSVAVFLDTIAETYDDLERKLTNAAGAGNSGGGDSGGIAERGRGFDPHGGFNPTRISGDELRDYGPIGQKRESFVDVAKSTQSIADHLPGGSLPNTSEHGRFANAGFVESSAVQVRGFDPNRSAFTENED